MEKLKLVLQSLNAISVSGKTNLDLLLGCMMMLESMIAEGGDTDAHDPAE